MGTENSASRLATFLMQVRIQERDSENRAVDVWKQIFGVSEETDLLKKAADIARLVDEVEAEVRALPEDEDPDHLLAYLPQIRDVLGTFFFARQVKMHQVMEKITGEMTYSIATCERALRRNGKVEPMISTESTGQLLEDVRAIIDDVVSSDLPNDLKKLLVDRLRGVEAALLDVRIGGYANVERAMDALTFGAVRATKPDSEERARVGSWLSRLWSKLSEHAQGAEAIASTAASTAEVVKAITGG